MMSDMNFRVTQKQVGNGIGTLLASIGIPIAIEAVKKLTGRGIREGSSMRIGNRGGAAMRLGRTPQFIGSWEGGGKKKRIGSTTRKKKIIIIMHRLYSATLLKDPAALYNKGDINLKSTG